MEGAISERWWWNDCCDNGRNMFHRSAAKSAATGERLAEFTRRRTKRSSPWQHWLASSWRTTAFWPRHPGYGEIWWNMVKYGWPLYERCLRCLGKKEKAAITFFLGAVVPAIWRPMSSFADRFWAHESHQLCMEVRQVWNAQSHCAQLHLPGSPNGRFLTWRDLKIIQVIYSKNRQNIRKPISGYSNCEEHPNLPVSPFEAGGTFDSTSGSSVSKSAPPLDSSRAYVRGVVVGTAVFSEGLQTQGSPFKAGNNVKLSAYRSANACLLGLLGMYKPSCCLAQVWFTSPHFRSWHMAFPGIFSVILRFGMVGMVSSAHGQTHNISQSSSPVCFLRLCWWHIIRDVILLQASQPPFNSNWGRRWRWQAAVALDFVHS